MAQVLPLHVFFSAEIHKVAPSKPLKRTHNPKTSVTTHRKGPQSPLRKTQKLNLEVSPHRAVSAVRLMRIEMGGAFADLLNEKGKGSGDNEMGYVGRTLGFRTKDLDDRDLRLVTDIVGGTIRWRRYLDYLIGSLCNDENTIKSMEPLLLQFMKVSVGLKDVRASQHKSGHKSSIKSGSGMIGSVHTYNTSWTCLPNGLLSWSGSVNTMSKLYAAIIVSNGLYRIAILRIGFYEILKLDMPAYAVVDENVRLAKVSLRPGAGNMVNGILRKLVLLKESNSLPLPKLEGDDRTQARALATLYSHPVWMVRRWTKYLGQEKAIKLMMWNNDDPSFSLRANSGKGVTRADLVMQLNMLKVPHELSLHLDLFVRVKTGLQIVIQAGLLKQGLCAVQDESAGLIVSVVDPKPGESIIDCCAAPGGKTLYMASQMHGQGMVYAIDINKGRLRILKETAKLHQVDGVITTIPSDLRTFAKSYPMKSDKVLLDAPCSGLGVLSKRADLRWNRRLEDLEELKDLQDELLDAASTLVKPGGVLVYSTCSIDPAENEERVDAFLLKHLEFHIDPVDRYVPPDFVTKRGFYSSDPLKHSVDGTFAARLIRALSFDSWKHNEHSKYRDLGKSVHHLGKDASHVVILMENHLSFAFQTECTWCWMVHYGSESSPGCRGLYQMLQPSEILYLIALLSDGYCITEIYLKMRGELWQKIC
ncbi:unnamed protein product [Dovyalis caffra]|uniref:SAM-dependent MTase RsmB/NOP-type domain-containing protein n=1 Tax=Dovyalis caffra TaxID=77055 RepID=A0AAV1SIG9_9ROSI|nr:unnamed protein product [Dovyalis caffra]